MLQSKTDLYVSLPSNTSYIYILNKSRAVRFQPIFSHFTEKKKEIPLLQVLNMFYLFFELTVDFVSIVVKYDLDCLFVNDVI